MRTGTCASGFESRRRRTTPASCPRRLERMEPEEAVDLYVEAWNVGDDGQRLDLVRRAFTNDAVRFGHDVAHGPDAIAATMYQIEVQRTSPVQVQGEWSRFEWAAVADGEHLHGVDVAEHATDGRVRRLIVFYTLRVPAER